MGNVKKKICSPADSEKIGNTCRQIRQEGKNDHYGYDAQKKQLTDRRQSW